MAGSEVFVTPMTWFGASWRAPVNEDCGAVYTDPPDPDLAAADCALPE